jgi:2-iminobutanoate/2-iminopropanoate deaminase
MRQIGCGVSSAMTAIKKQIATDSAPQAVGSYSQAVQSGEWLFLSGQIALDPVSGLLVGESAVEQADRVLKNILAVLQAAGGDFSNLLKVTIFLVDLADFAGVDSVYSSYLKPPYPARATVGVAALPKGALIEIEAMARLN